MVIYKTPQQKTRATGGRGGDSVPRETKGTPAGRVESSRTKLGGPSSRREAVGTDALRPRSRTLRTPKPISPREYRALWVEQKTAEKRKIGEGTPRQREQVLKGVGLGKGATWIYKESHREAAIRSSTRPANDGSRGGDGSSTYASSSPDAPWHIFEL